MAEDIVAADPADASVLDRFPMRDEDGEIRREFVEEIARAIHAAEIPFLRAVVAELHEADLGDLIAALEPEDRVSLVELTGTDFDFSALNEVDDSVREEILEELEPETVAVAKSDPADARRQPLEGDAFARHVEPVMQRGVVGQQFLDLGIGAVNVFGIA